MNIIKNKTYRTYDYTSRYASIPYYFNTEDNTYFYGLTKQLSKNNTYVIHKVTESDTLDSIAFTYYGRPDLFWVVAEFNNIKDPFNKLFGRCETLNVPTITNISFED